MSTQREVIWSVSAKATYGSLPETTRKSLEKWVNIVSENALSDRLKGRLHKVRRANYPDLYYLRLGARYRVFMNIFPSTVEIWAIVDHPAMLQLIKTIDRA